MHQSFQVMLMQRDSCVKHMIIQQLVYRDLVSASPIATEWDRGKLRFKKYSLSSRSKRLSHWVEWLVEGDTIRRIYGIWDQGSRQWSKKNSSCFPARGITALNFVPTYQASGKQLKGGSVICTFKNGEKKQLAIRFRNGQLL